MNVRRGVMVGALWLIACGSGWAQEMPAELKARLQRRVTLDFSETPVGDTVQFLREVTGVNMLLDPRVALELPITAQLEQVTVEDAMDQLLRPLGLRSGCRCGVLVVARELRLKAFPVAAPAIPAEADPAAPCWGALKKRVTFDFTDTPLTDVTGYLAALGLPIRLDGWPEGAGPNVTLALRDLEAQDVLTLLAFVTKSQLVFEKDKITIRPAPAPRWADVRAELVAWAEETTPAEADAIGALVARLDAVEAGPRDAARAELVKLGRKALVRLVDAYEADGLAPDRRAGAKKVLEDLSGLEIPDP